MVIYVAIVVFLAIKFGTLGSDMTGCLALCILPCVDADQAFDLLLGLQVVKKKK